MGIRGQALLALLVLFSGFQSFAENKLANTARETLAFPGFQPPPAPAIGPGRCQITARAPDLVTPWGTWKVKSVDVDENFILLHYNNTNPPSRPGFFQNYILVWLKGTNIGPWVVYAGNATLYNPRVSSLGHVAVRRYSPGSPYPEEQLVVCPFDLNRGIGQWDPYACAVDPSQAIVVNTTPYNQPLGNIPNSLPDGDISSWDWSGDYLAYANRSISQGFSGISDWSLQTLSGNTIAGGFSPQIRYVVKSLRFRTPLIY
jgi:hypothetical protein